MFEPYKTDTESLVKDALSALSSPELPTLIAVAKDVKPLADLWVMGNSYKKLQAFCRKYGLVIDHDNYMGAQLSPNFIKEYEKKREMGTTKLLGMPYGEGVPDTWMKVFIARSQKIIDEGKKVNWYNLIINNDFISDPALDNFTFGENLGFPQCCIDFYAFHNMKFPESKTGFNTPIEVFKNTHNKFSIFCNNIPMGHWYFLIRHHPCSFNCQQTIKYAKELLKCIKEEDETYANKIVQHLKYPLLVFGEKNAFAFDGIVKQNKLSYRDIYFCGDERDKHKADIFLQGNQIEVTDEEIIINKDGSPIKKIPKNGKYDGVIIQFE